MATFPFLLFEQLILLVQYQEVTSLCFKPQTTTF